MRNDDETPPDGPARPRLLVVEDEATHQWIALRTLSRHFDLTLATTAQQALSLLEERSFEAVLVDIILGDGLNGTEMMRAFRSRHPEDLTPFIAYTAYAGLETPDELIREGFQACCLKPVLIDHLVEVIHQVLPDGKP